MPTTVRPLERADLPRAAALAAAAFADDPGFLYITRGDPSLLAALIEASLTVDFHAGALAWGAYSPELDGVAVLYPEGPRVPGILAWLRCVWTLRGLLARPAALARAVALHQLIDAARPKEAAYFKMLAVRPEGQGQGAGSALIEAACAGRSHVYLETATGKNSSYYARRGFRQIDVLKGQGMPELWTMERRAARSAS